MNMSIEKKIALVKARITAPTLEDPRLDFKPDSILHRTLPGSARELHGETFFPWTQATPTGRPARIPARLIGRPLQIAFGRFHWIDRVTYRSQPAKPPIERDTPIFLADAIADRERNGFVVTSQRTVNTLIVKWIEKNGGTASLSPRGELTTDFIDFEIIDDINVGCFLGKAALPARAFETRFTSPAVQVLLGGHAKELRHACVNMNIPLDPALDLDQRDVVRYIISGHPILVRGGPGCGKTRAVSEAIRVMIEGGSSIAFASPVPGAIRSIRRLLPDLSFTTIDMSKGELLQHTVDTLIVDEASAITPLQTMPLAAKATQIVVIGDPMQCPPPKPLPRIDGEESLLTWAMKLRTFLQRELRYHYRTPHPIVTVPANLVFYKMRLRIVPVPWTNPLDGLYIHKLDGDRYDGAVHADEVERVVTLITRISKTDPARSIMVVTLNLKTRATIAAKIEKRYPTVRVLYARHAQGDEADDVILVTAPGNERGLDNHPDTFEMRLLAVALSRARRSLHIVIGPKFQFVPYPIQLVQLALKRFAQSQTSFPDTMDLASHAMDRFGSDEVEVCDFGCVVAIRRRTSPDWEVGVMPPPQPFLSKEENQAIKRLLLAKGWTLVDPYGTNRG